MERLSRIEDNGVSNEDNLVDDKIKINIIAIIN